MSSTAEAGPQARARLSPRKRRQIGRGVQYAVLVAVVVVLALTANWSALGTNFADLKVAAKAFPEVLTVGLKNTIIYTLTSYIFGFVVGMVVALMRLSSVAPYRIIALVYIEIFRGVPALLVLMLFAFGIPIAFPDFAFPVDPYGTVTVALGLVAAAYMAETFRAGIQAVPKGQMEAARTLGMSYPRAMGTVIIPQAVRIVIPPLTNELISLFKDSSLVFGIGVTDASTELTKFGRDVATDQANATPLLLAGMLYLVITVPASYLVRRLEKKQGASR